MPRKGEHMRVFVRLICTYLYLYASHSPKRVSYLRTIKRFSIRNVRSPNLRQAEINRFPRGEDKNYAYDRMTQIITTHNFHF